MTSKRSIIFFWALFFVPTLIMAAAAFRLLLHEQERINRANVEALTQQAQTIAQTIHLTLEGVRDNLTQSLRNLPADKIKENLLEWERINPLVRNVFIWDKEKKLIYPKQGMASTNEERLFTSRYAGLFSGRHRFETAQPTIENEIPQEQTLGLTHDYDRIAQKKMSSRRQLESLSRVAQKTAPAESVWTEVKSSPGFDVTASGWIPWFYENQVSILIWVRTGQTRPVYGLELELMTLLSRLVVDFPVLENEKDALVLMDGNNNHIHQSGRLTLDLKMKPVSRVPVSYLLPHWQIGIFMDETSGTGNGFLVLSLILLGIFIAAIVSGGVLLTRISLQNLKNARQKTSFVSSVSHELKTPLTSIRMYAELLQSGRITDETKKANYLSVIVSESQRLTRLINNVLDFGRLEQGKKNYHFTTFDMETFLYQTIEAHKIRIKKQGLEIITQVKKGDFQINTDRDAVEQVVLNLLDNVLKYAGDGSFIKFILERETRDTVLMKICDNGPGIPKDQCKRVFEKFHRIDNSLTAAQPGSGLGLSISRNIQKDLGGDLYLEPVKEGCCFTARIKHHESD